MAKKRIERTEGNTGGDATIAISEHVGRSDAGTENVALASEAVEQAATEPRPTRNAAGIPRISPLDFGDGGADVAADIGNSHGGNTGSQAGTDTERKRGGRPLGSVNKAKKDVGLAQTLLSVEGTLRGVHVGLAALLGNPAWELSDKEASEYAGAVRDLAEQYPGVQIAPKTMAWVGFSAVIAGIYIPRVKQMMAVKPRPMLVAKQPLPGNAEASTPAPAQTTQSTAQHMGQQPGQQPVVDLGVFVRANGSNSGASSDLEM